MALNFQPHPDESANDRLARFHETFLAPGPVGWGDRPADMRALLEASWLPPIPWRQDGTTCALYQGSALQASGVQARRRVNSSYAITTWMAVNDWSGDEWISRERIMAGEPIMRGDIWYICSDAGSMTVGGRVYKWTHWRAALNGHVGCALSGSGFLWRTAEGGGANGQCRLSMAAKDLTKLGRKLQGVVRPNLMDSSIVLVPDPLFDDEPTIPGRPTPQSFEWRTLRLKSPRMTGPDVKAWQDVLILDGFGALLGPSKADGNFGPMTDSATKSWQRSRRLVADGIVGPLTRAAIGRTKPTDARVDP